MTARSTPSRAAGTAPFSFLLSLLFCRLSLSMSPSLPDSGCATFSVQRQSTKAKFTFALSSHSSGAGADRQAGGRGKCGMSAAAAFCAKLYKGIQRHTHIHTPRHMLARQVPPLCRPCNEAEIACSALELFAL